MKVHNLRSGLTIHHQPSPFPSTAIHIKVCSGSVNDVIAGTAHILEHTLFEGTKTFKNSKKLTSFIEDLGGELNAYTGLDSSNYYCIIPNKHLNKAVKVLQSMFNEPLLRKKDLLREIKVIKEEILSQKDDFMQELGNKLFKTVYKNTPVATPASGTLQSIKKIKISHVKNYYKKHYNKKNIIITVVGKMPTGLEKIGLSKGQRTKHTFYNGKFGGNKTLQRKVGSCYHAQAYAITSLPVFDILENIFDKGQSGVLFHYLRTKHHAAYDVGAEIIQSQNQKLILFYGVGSKLNVIKSAMQEALESDINEDMLKIAKESVIGNIAIQKSSIHNYMELLTKYPNLKEYEKKIIGIKMQDLENTLTKATEINLIPQKKN